MRKTFVQFSQKVLHIKKNFCENCTSGKLFVKNAQKFSTRGNVEMWKCGNVEMWKCGNVEMWKCGNVEMWKCGNVEKYKNIKI